MLKYKGSDIVVYFTYKDLDYRRVDGIWEVKLEDTWVISKECGEIEEKYKKRVEFRNLITRRDELNSSCMSAYDSDNKLKDNELTKIVRRIIDIIGIDKYIDNTSQEILDMLDNGEIELNNI